MRIAQIVLPDATLYARKSQRIDAVALEALGHEVALADDLRAFDVALIYGKRGVVIKRPTKWWQRSRKIAVTHIELPEAVDDIYFTPRAERSTPHLLIASTARPSVKNAIEQTLHRIARTREDIEWRLFDELPSPDDFAQIGVWVDPAIDDHDFDGGTAEALVAGCVVIASRTIVNRKRCEEGRTGWLVPPNDPNEMTHAILSALFKPESGQQRAEAAQQTRGKFRSRVRARELMKHLVSESL